MIAQIEQITGSAVARGHRRRASGTSRSPLDPIAASLLGSAEDAEAVGLLDPVDLDGIYDLTLLNELAGGTRRRADRSTMTVTDQRDRGPASVPQMPDRPRGRATRRRVTITGVVEALRRRRPRRARPRRHLARRRRGEFVCLVGASGCGKSTLLSLVAGLDPPTPGTVAVDGRTALMFQDAALLPWRTAAANVELPMKLRGVRRAERRAAARELLDLVRLGEFADKRPHELSGGMRQRVALARALAQDADVLLMDEPFGALDAITRDVLHDEIERVAAEQRLTVLFVTHNVREAARLGDRILLLSSRPGRVVAEFPVTVPRPRRIEAPDVAAIAAEVTARLREEVRRHAADDARPRARRARPPRATGGHPAGRSGARTWAATWPKLAAIGLCLLSGRSLVWREWRPEYVLPAPGGRRRRACGTTSARPTSGGPSATRCAAPSSASPSRSLIGGLIGHRGVAGARAARRHRLDDHRAADDAVDRVVPARDPALRPERGGDPLRRRARRRAVDRQRDHRRHRQRAAVLHRVGRTSAPAASRSTATSSCRRPCRRCSPGSSRAGRSRGAASWPASCS